MKRKKIAIFQANLNVGGIQRSLVNLLSSDILKEYEVDLYLFSRDIFYDISRFKENIHIFFLKPFPYWFRFIPFGIIKKFSFYQNIPDKYDFVFDFDSYRQECAYCTTKMLKPKKVLWIHNDMEKEFRFNKKYRILYLFMKGKFQYYDTFAAVSKGVVNPFRTYSGQKEAPVVIIPNIINTEEILDKSSEVTDITVDPMCCNVICVGRIYVQKGYDFLLKDFNAAYQKRKDLRCYIVGDGPDADYYKKWVKNHGLSNVVYFLGNRKNPFSIMKQMDAFCIESRYEGQGLVLWEAKCLGLQLIFPKRLEKYNSSLAGVDSVVEALVKLEKKEKKQNHLIEYYENIVKQYGNLLWDSFENRCNI